MGTERTASLSVARCEQRLVRAAKMERGGEAAVNGRVGGRGVYHQQGRVSFRDQMEQTFRFRRQQREAWAAY